MAPGNTPPMTVYDGEYALEGKNKKQIRYNQPGKNKNIVQSKRIICKVKELFQNFHISRKKAHKIRKHNNTRNITAMYCSLLNDTNCCNINQISEEIADIFIYLTYLCHEFKIDLFYATLKKIEKNAVKYPIEKSKGSSKKYNEL